MNPCPRTSAEAKSSPRDLQTSANASSGKRGSRARGGVLRPVHGFSVPPWGATTWSTASFLCSVGRSLQLRHRFRGMELLGALIRRQAAAVTGKCGVAKMQRGPQGGMAKEDGGGPSVCGPGRNGDAIGWPPWAARRRACAERAARGSGQGVEAPGPDSVPACPSSVRSGRLSRSSVGDSAESLANVVRDERDRLWGERPHVVRSGTRRRTTATTTVTTTTAAKTDRTAKVADDTGTTTGTATQKDRSPSRGQGTYLWHRTEILIQRQMHPACARSFECPPRGTMPQRRRFARAAFAHRRKARAATWAGGKSWTPGADEARRRRVAATQERRRRRRRSMVKTTTAKN
jgi:hypothetical protein